jgi:hypothetical protein
MPAALGANECMLTSSHASRRFTSVHAGFSPLQQAWFTYPNGRTRHLSRASDQSTHPVAAQVTSAHADVPFCVRARSIRCDVRRARYGLSLDAHGGQGLERRRIRSRRSSRTVVHPGRLRCGRQPTGGARPQATLLRASIRDSSRRRTWRARPPAAGSRRRTRRLPPV